MPKAAIKNSIRALRFAQGEMTQQELADRAGCTRQTIIVLEQERYVPSLVLAIRIARVFGKPVDEVFSLED
jgi:putative transcriptional regulator